MNDTIEDLPDSVVRRVGQLVMESTNLRAEVSRLIEANNEHVETGGELLQRCELLRRERDALRVLVEESVALSEKLILLVHQGREAIRAALGQG